MHRFMDRSLSTIEEFYDYRNYVLLAIKMKKLSYVPVLWNTPLTREAQTIGQMYKIPFHGFEMQWN